MRFPWTLNPNFNQRLVRENFNFVLSRWPIKPDSNLNCHWLRKVSRKPKIWEREKKNGCYCRFCIYSGSSFNAVVYVHQLNLSQTFGDRKKKKHHSHTHTHTLYKCIFQKEARKGKTTPSFSELGARWEGGGGTRFSRWPGPLCEGKAERGTGRWQATLHGRSVWRFVWGLLHDAINHGKMRREAYPPLTNSFLPFPCFLPSLYMQEGLRVFTRLPASVCPSPIQPTPRGKA